jgi:hypothetical protein
VTGIEPISSPWQEDILPRAIFYSVYPPGSTVSFYVTVLLLLIVYQSTILMATKKTNPIHNDAPKNTMYLLFDQPSGEANTMEYTNY